MSDILHRTTDDAYGRHALIQDGPGANPQHDVSRFIVGLVHLTRFDPDYLGRHRVTWWDIQIDGPVIK